MSVRIAYVISTLDRCGPVNVLYDIVHRLAPDHELAVFTLAPEALPYCRLPKPPAAPPPNISRKKSE